MADVMGKPTAVDAQRALDVYLFCILDTESFAEQHIGEDLAYLMGAILMSNKCEWDATRPIVKLLENGFPEPWIWTYIDVVTDG